MDPELREELKKLDIDEDAVVKLLTPDSDGGEGMTIWEATEATYGQEFDHSDRQTWLFYSKINAIRKRHGLKANKKYRPTVKDDLKANKQPTPPIYDAIKDAKLAKSLGNADRLLNLGMYDQAIREYGSIIERLLKKLYQNYFPNLPIQCKEKILNYERASKMPINKFTIGQWIGLFRSAGLFGYIAQDKKGKGESFVFFIPSILDTLNKLRNKSTHSTTDYEHYINKNSAFFVKATMMCILHELGE